MKYNCNLCNKKEIPIYTSLGYKMTPLCLECYKKNRKPAKNKYKKLMNKLSNKGYVWVLNFGDYDFPFTFFGLEVSFYQIVQYFFKFIESDNYTLQSQEDCVFDFDDYSDPIIIETCITFVNNNDGSSYTINIRMGKYNYHKKEILFFSDKQLGLSKSNLFNYSSYLLDDDNELTETVPDFEEQILFSDKMKDRFDKPFFNEDDLNDLVGYIPEIDD